MNLAGLLPASAAELPDRPALRLGDVTVTYRELEEGAARVAGFLRARGIGPGDRVAVMLPNLPQFALAYYGALRLGAIVVPMNPLLKRREVAFLLRDAGSPMIFALTGYDEHPRAAAQDVGATCVTVGFEGFDPEVEGAEPVHEVVGRAGEDTAV